ncbi:MAG: glycosyltransferase [Thermoplasmatales archaeon]|nr:glycosyltransferase [Thermoplasmatales archaeon]
MDNLQKAEELVETLQQNLEKIEKKDFNIYFFIIDTNGAPVGSVANIYEHVKMLNSLGYKACILHEKNEYATKQLEFIKNWLGEEYSSLPHASIEDKEVKINMVDYIIIPELFANVMEQTVNLPGKRVVFCQSYDYITETLQAGKTWSDYNITDCITTTEKQKEYIDGLFNGKINTKVVPVAIDERFKKPTKLKKPIINILTRDQRETVKIFKTFYLKYPHLKWVTFRDMRGMPMEKFAQNLSECCISVWVDDVSGFGTFPLESMKCDIPVLGKVPNMVPEWMEDKNGLWTHDFNAIPDILANYVQAWLEDASPDELYEKMGETAKKYNEEEQKEKILEVYSEIIGNRVNEFKSKLELLQPVNNEQ